MMLMTPGIDLPWPQEATPTWCSTERAVHRWHKTAKAPHLQPHPWTAGQQASKIQYQFVCVCVPSCGEETCHSQYRNRDKDNAVVGGSQLQGWGRKGETIQCAFIDDDITIRSIPQITCTEMIGILAKVGGNEQVLVPTRGGSRLRGL